MPINACWLFWLWLSNRYFCLACVALTQVWLFLIRESWDSLAGPTSHLECALAASLVSEMGSCIWRGCCPMASWQDVSLISPPAAKSVGKGSLPRQLGLFEGSLWMPLGMSSLGDDLPRVSPIPKVSFQHETKKFVFSVQRQKQSLVPFLLWWGPISWSSVWAWLFI